MKGLRKLFILFVSAITISSTIACQHATGGQTSDGDDNTFWNDSAYKRYAEVQQLFNTDQHDSLLAVAPETLEFLREHKQWYYYYILWQDLAEDHVWYGEYTEAFSEAEAMQKDAIARNDTFGLALSYITQGTAYMAQDDYAEAENSYSKAISIYPKNGKKGGLVSMYGYYADCLDNTGNYAKMDSLLNVWHVLLDNIPPTDDSDDAEAYADWHYQYYNRNCNYLINIDSLTQATAAVDSMVYYAKLSGITNNHLFNIYKVQHQLAIAQGKYSEALNFADKMIELNIDDVAYKLRALQDRSEAFEKLGRYHEALADMREYKMLTDSTTQSDNREQLNRLNKRYQINELQAQNDLLLQRSRFTTGGVAMILGIVALLAFLSVNSRWTRRIEIKNQQLQRERNVVVKQNKQLEQERDRAEAASKAKTAFIQSMTHEIRTPLNSISGFSQVLTMTGTDITPEIRIDMSQRIMDGTRMLTNILDDLILISDFESRTDPSPTEDCLIDSVVNQTIDTVGSLLSEGVKIDYKSSISPELTIKTNPMIIQKVLVKLLENAAKFTTEGSITLTTDITDGKLYFAIIDTGPGIPADKHEYVFERFAKLDNFSQGAGLGLTIARMLAEHMGGSVTIDAGYSGGSKFDVIIPIA